jgi:hypothetical protein
MTNVRPTVAVVIPPAGVAGRPYTLSLSADDPGPDATAWRIDWGDNSGLQTVRARTAAPTHTYALARSYTVRVTPFDEDGTYPVATATMVVGAGVAGRYAYYNNSSYDNNSPAPLGTDDGAIAAGKSALLPSVRAAAANVTNYAKGVNGVILDFAGHPFAADPTSADFVFRTGTGGDPAAWQTLSATPRILTRRGSAIDSADRVTIALPDGTARNAWLQVTVLANARTKLVAPDVFFFGNLPGDTGNDRGTPVVDARDEAITRRNFGRTTAAALAASDFNRDGKVDAADVAIVRSNLRHALPPFTAPAAATSPAFADTPIPPRTARPARRRFFDAPAAIW